MTNIEQMIQDLCPNGVEFKTLGEVCTIETGKLNANAAEENGQYPFFTTSKEISYINEYKWDTEALLIAGNANIGDVKHYIGKFNAYQRTYVLTNFQDGLIVRFLYHYTKARLKDFLDDKKNEAAMSYIVLSSLQAFPIPLPPLEIQKKIVECLDKFSALAAELQAELQMRRKQYEYYRTQLLTPHSDCNSADNTDDAQWEWKTLGEICTILRGKRLTKSELSEDEKYPVFHGGIEPLGYYKEHNREADTVMIINVGASAGTVGYSDKEFWSSDGCYCLSKSESAIPKFMYYLLQKRESELKSRVRYAGIPTLDSDVIKKMQIALPPLAEQARIVAILDKFEALTTSLSDGIPAEQAAQQKRYEYYRDKLLTFEKRP